jgi:hypothetical protein
VKAGAFEFRSDEIQKNVDTCTRLRADVFVMAACDRINEESQTEAKELCDGAGIGLLVLNGSDLRSGL